MRRTSATRPRALESAWLAPSVDLTDDARRGLMIEGGLEVFMAGTTSLLFILLAGSMSASEAANAQAPQTNRAEPAAPSLPSRARMTIEVADYCSPAQIAIDISQCGQAAIAAAGAGANASTGGGTVHFPAGLYKLLGTLRLDKSFVG